jgi:hypothetical protein
MVDERLREHSERIRSMETSVSDMRVQNTKILTKQEALDERITQFHGTFSDFRQEIKADRGELLELLKQQVKDHKEAREAEERKQEGRRQWIRDVFTPQTIVLMLTILAGALGISLNQPTAPVSTTVSIEDRMAPPIEIGEAAPEEAESLRD